MWHWIRHWHDWAMSEIVTPHRLASQSQSLYFSCEKAGFVFPNQPILWNADAVLVEALLRLPASARKRGDFALRLPGSDAIAADGFRKDEDSDRYRVFFRFAPPGISTTAELYWRTHLLGKIELPVLTPAEFASDLRIVLPSVFVSIGGRSVAAQTFVASQCKALSAVALVRSSTGLAPLLDANLRAVFQWARTGRTEDVPIPLVASQLNGKEALISASPAKLPKRAGEWTVAWMLDDKLLASQRVRAVSPKTFYDSLRITDTRFAVDAGKSAVRVVRHLPPLGEIHRAAPCFVVSSREPGIAGLAPLELKGQVSGGLQSVLLVEQSHLISDGPSLVAGNMHDVRELAQFHAFELFCNRRSLGCLPLSPVPLATLNAEGGFRPPTEFLWSSTAEDELLERMSKLMEVDRGK